MCHKLCPIARVMNMQRKKMGRSLSFTFSCNEAELYDNQPSFALVGDDHMQASAKIQAEKM